MRGVKLLGESRAETRDWPDPSPEGADVVVRVEAAAICGSDLHFLYQTPNERPNVPGHEMAGVVTAVDKPQRLRVGDRVCLSPIRGCGECELCRAGCPAYCRNGRGAYGFSCDGVHAEYARIAEDCLLPLPDSVSFEDGCLILDPVGTPFHAHKRIGTAAGHVVAVFGLGPMGLGAVLTAAHLGARVIGIDIVEYRRKLAESLGAAVTLDPKAGDIVQMIRDATNGQGLDRALECAGRADTLKAALDTVRPFGHVAIIGENSEAVIRPSEHFNRKEITLSGSCCFPLGEYPDILAALAAGLNPGRLITHRFDLEHAAEGYSLFAGGQTGKVILSPH